MDGPPSLDRRPLYPLEAQTSTTNVCVTGATGFLAGSVIARLLAAGHYVHATCRDLNASNKLEAIQSLPGAKERLKLFEADLEVPESFTDAIRGCEYVLHLAAVFRLRVPKGKGRELIINPALNGICNLLNTVNASKSVKRVVLTSSVAAIVGSTTERGLDHIFTEDDWNLTCSDESLPYHHSKKLVEEKAQEFCAQQSRWSLVVLNPGMIFGPAITNAKCESFRFMRQLLNGAYYGWMADIGFGVVDIDDVAAAHCLAMLTPQANGRYILVAESLTLKSIVELLREKWSDFKLPYLQAPFWFVWILSFFFSGLNIDLLSAIWGPPPKFDNSRGKCDLGLTYLDPRRSLDDMVERMIELKIVKYNPTNKPSNYNHKTQ